MPVFVVGSIIFGIATPTEAAGVAVAYALFLGFVVYRKLTLRSTFEVMKRSAVLTASVSFTVAGAAVISYVASSEQITVKMTEGLLSISNNPLVILFVINAILFVLGFPLEPLPLTMMLIPILFPVATESGYRSCSFCYYIRCEYVTGIDYATGGCHALYCLSIGPDFGVQGISGSGSLLDRASGSTCHHYCVAWIDFMAAKSIDAMKRERRYDTGSLQIGSRTIRDMAILRIAIRRTQMCQNLVQEVGYERREEKTCIGDLHACFSSVCGQRRGSGLYG